MPAQEFRVEVPTVIDGIQQGEAKHKVIIRVNQEIRIVLGTHEFDDYSFSDVLIERQEGRWVIIVHPNGADPCGDIVIHDNGSPEVNKLD